MTRGLSLRQLALAGLYLLGLAVTLVLVVIQAWAAAAVAAVLSFAVFSVLVVLTLAAMTRTHESSRRHILELSRSTGHDEISRDLRRLNKHYGLITGSLRGSEDRIAAAERRMLSALEAHRNYVEDALENIADPRQDKGPSA